VHAFRRDTHQKTFALADGRAKRSMACCSDEQAKKCAVVALLECE
jgi:hypothetical protein